jgi:hypothetical protein
MALNQEHRVLRLTEQHMLQLGLEFAGKQLMRSENSNVRKFKDLYGPHPKSAAKCFIDLQTKEIGDARIEKIDPFYFLVTLYWLRGYGTDTRVSAAFGIQCSETKRDHCWKYTAAIHALAAHNVRKSIEVH